LKLINGLVAVALLISLLENKEPYIPAATALLVLVWAFSLRLSKGFGFERLEWAIVICLGYWLTNYFWSTRDFHNLISYEFLRRDGALLVSYTTFLGFLGWPLKPGQCGRFWLVFLTCLGLIAVVGVVYCLYLFPYPEYAERLGFVAGETFFGGVREVRGWYETHNTAGGVYAMATLLSLTLVREAPLSPKLRQFAWALFLSCLCALVFTWSRTGYLAFLVGVAFILPLRKLGTTIKVGLLIGVLVLVFGLMNSTVFSRIDSITDPYYGTNADRFRLWGDALDDFFSSPIIGIGFGRYNDLAVQFEGVKGLLWVGVHGQIFNGDNSAHDSYLHFLAEGGIIGLMLTLRVWRRAWMELSLYQSRMAKSQLRGFHKGAKACLLACLWMAFTEHMLGKGSVMLVLMSLIGTVLAASRMEWRALQQAQKNVPRPAQVRTRLDRIATLSR
jgi:O-antigen ligase